MRQKVGQSSPQLNPLDTTTMASPECQPRLVQSRLSIKCARCERAGLQAEASADSLAKPGWAKARVPTLARFSRAMRAVASRLPSPKTWYRQFARFCNARVARQRLLAAEPPPSNHKLTRAYLL